MSFVSIVKGLLPDGKAIEIGASGIRGDSLKVLEDQSYLLEEILIELKINNYILNEVHDMNVTEKDIRK